MRLLYHIVHRGNMNDLKTKEMFKSKKIAPIKNVDLELLHHILGHGNTRS